MHIQNIMCNTYVGRFLQRTMEYWCITSLVGKGLKECTALLLCVQHWGHCGCQGEQGGVVGGMETRGTAPDRKGPEGLPHFCIVPAFDMELFLCPQKREAQVLDRWKKLTRGVLIRERVKRTYSLSWLTPSLASLISVSTMNVCVLQLYIIACAHSYTIPAEHICINIFSVMWRWTYGTQFITKFQSIFSNFL